MKRRAQNARQNLGSNVLYYLCSSNNYSQIAEPVATSGPQDPNRSPPISTPLHPAGLPAQPAPPCNHRFGRRQAVAGPAVSPQHWQARLPASPELQTHRSSCKDGRPPRPPTPPLLLAVATELPRATDGRQSTRACARIRPHPGGGGGCEPASARVPDAACSRPAQEPEEPEAAEAAEAAGEAEEAEEEEEAEAEEAEEEGRGRRLEWGP